MKLQRAGDLMTAIARLPEDHFVTFNKERDEEDTCWLLTACVFQAAPEDGWPSRGAYFNHPLDAASHKEPCPPQWKHDVGVRFGVNSDPATPEILERLLINAINQRWGQT